MHAARMFRAVRPLLLGAAGALLSAGLALAAEIGDFEGAYVGSADVTLTDGSSQTRDMSVRISETRRGFTVEWSTVSYRSDGSAKQKAYSIDFRPSERDNVFAAAMRKDVFGNEVQLNPMKGEPYVWARIAGDTLTVYSLFVTEEGGYEIQQFDRTLTDAGLRLEFQTVQDGQIGRSVSTVLQKQ